QQDHRIEIALERDAIADPPPRRSQIHRPVNANTLGAAVRKFLEPGPAAFGEENGRYAAWREKWKRVEHRTHRSERETTPFRGGEQAAPRVEQHDRIGPGGNLLAEVACNGLRIDFYEPLEQIAS